MRAVPVVEVLHRPPALRASRDRGGAHAAGFTLIELVMVLVLTGVLAVYAAPQVLSVSGFNARGFHDESLALLRYAQKTAIAQRRPVCVAFTSNSVTLRVDLDRNSATGTNGCEANLAGPRGEMPAAASARGSVQFASVPAGLVFDPLGSPGAALSAQVSGASRQITVEATTGYVHD